MFITPFKSRLKIHSLFLLSTSNILFCSRILDQQVMITFFWGSINFIYFDFVNIFQFLLLNMAFGDLSKVLAFYFLKNSFKRCFIIGVFLFWLNLGLFFVYQCCNLFITKFYLCRFSQSFACEELLGIFIWIILSKVVFLFSLCLNIFLYTTKNYGVSQIILTL